VSEQPIEQKPMLRVVRGTPDAAELAALVAVIGARSAGGAPVEETPQSGWSDRGQGLRSRLAHGPGAWRRSARSTR
jgi:hypothetical protein